MRQALLIRIWQLSAILLLTSSSLKLFQVGWGQMHIFRFLQKYLIGFKLSLWLGHSKTFTELSISHSCCVFRVIVLLEGKPSAQSEVLNALDWVFIKAISVFWSIELFFYSNESLSPGCWTTGDVHSWFPSNMMLGIEVHQTRESCFSESEGPLSLGQITRFLCRLRQSLCQIMRFWLDRILWCRG